MQEALESFLLGSALAFMLAFVRIGTAIMIMPGLGDSFVPERIRLHIALGTTLVLFPIIQPYIPNPVPSTFTLFTIILMEFIIGVLIGSVARIFMLALDTAGMVISMQSGLANAQVFNPSLSAQGSLVGAFLSITGVLILFESNLHHLLLAGVVNSYQMFPLGEIPDTGSMAELITKSVAASFSIGIRLATPFMVLTLLIYVGIGVLSRLMPQVQVFMIAMPVQLLLSFMLLLLVLSSLIYIWLGQYESALTYFLSAAGN